MSSKEQIKEIFLSKADCFADESRTITAMTRQAFIEAIEMLLAHPPSPDVPDINVGYTPATVQERIDAEYPDIASRASGIAYTDKQDDLRRAMQKGYTLAMQTVAAEINKTENYHPYKVSGQHDTYSNYNQGWSDAMGALESELFMGESLPAMQEKAGSGPVMSAEGMSVGEVMPPSEWITKNHPNESVLWSRRKMMSEYALYYHSAMSVDANSHAMKFAEYLKNRIEYLYKQENLAIDELDEMEVGSTLRKMKWKLITTLSDKRHELEDAKKELTKSNPITNTSK